MKKDNVIRMLVVMLLWPMIVRGTEIPCDSVLRRQAANMLMVGFRGDSVYEGCDAWRYVHELHVGCVVLFDVDLTGSATIGSRNITSKDRLKAMTAHLQQWSDQPLLIALDQEGGKVARLKPQYGFTPTMTAAHVGEVNLEDTTRMYADVMAREMRECGVNFNLAPVVDIANDSCPVIAGFKRAYSADPAEVARHAGWFIDQHHSHGVACAMKHFPGHGSSRGDTHYGLVDVTETWDPAELLPFRALIESGLADAIMTAHIYNRNIDPDLPATLSYQTVTGLLRNELGYDGVVVTDDLYMEGIIGEYGVEDAMVRAINAGADLICVGNNIKTGFEADRPSLLIDMIVRAVKDGRIAPERLAEANSRTDQLRSRTKWPGIGFLDPKISEKSF